MDASLMSSSDSDEAMRVDPSGNAPPNASTSSAGLDTTTASSDMGRTDAFRDERQMRVTDISSINLNIKDENHTHSFAKDDDTASVTSEISEVN